MLFETEVPENVCILNNERSKPPALAEKSKYLSENLNTEILRYSRYFPSKFKKNMHSGNNLSSLHNKTFKDLGVFGSFVQINHSHTGF